jgi:hypothetical protein
LEHRIWRLNLCNSQLIIFVPHLKRQPWSDPETLLLYLCSASLSGLIQVV